MSKMKAPEGYIKVFALVRDKHGKPKFKDVNDIPDNYWGMLTKTEKEEINNVRITPRHSS